MCMDFLTKELWQVCLHLCLSNNFSLLLMSHIGELSHPCTLREECRNAYFHSNNTILKIFFLSIIYILTLTYGDFWSCFCLHVVLAFLQAKHYVDTHAHKVSNNTVCEVWLGRSEHSSCLEESTKAIQACFSVQTPWYSHRA